MRMSILTFALLSLSFILVSQAEAKNQQLNFAINAPGSSPYIYFEHSLGKYQGVVVDFFTKLEESNDIKIIYVDSSRARIEKLLISEKADIFLSSAEWLKQPDAFIFSHSIAQHKSYMYSTNEFNQTFIPSQNNGALICTRYNFTYPVLDPFFNNNTFLRVDSSSQSSMTHMLARGRCDFTIMSDDNARAIMYQPEFCDTEFYQSPNVISSVETTFVIRPELSDIKERIDTQLAIFINSGERDSSIIKHVGSRVFPKALCTD